MMISDSGIAADSLLMPEKYLVLLHRRSERTQGLHYMMNHELIRLQTLQSCNNHGHPGAERHQSILSSLEILEVR
jgi:hypothetical protein